MRIITKPVSLILTTDELGEASLSLVVPQSFNGISDDKNGRFFKCAKIWTDNGTDGDRIYGLKLEDTDGILTSLYNVGQFPIPSSVFPSYPTLIMFEDDDISETSLVKKGYFLKPGDVLVLDKIDPRESFDFIPSGMYLKATFKTANVVALGQKCRVNIYWGKSQ